MRTVLDGDALTVLLVAGLIPVAIVWWMAARVARRWGRRFRRHPIRTTITVAAVFRRRPAVRRPPPPVVATGDDIYRNCPLSRWKGGPWACRWCNELIPRGRTMFCGPKCNDEATDNHVFSQARKVRRRMDGHACVQCGSDQALEVDHIDPALGRHNVPDCIHHLTNLRTLCGGGGNSCHQRRTNAQRSRRWAS